jgi:Tfp pilus assembly protein PilX
MEQDHLSIGPLSHPRVQALKSTQRGVVLFIALIVMVVMSLAAIALMRAVDTTSAVIGNLAFRQASMLPANYAVEFAASGLFDDANAPSPRRIADLNNPDAAENYLSTHDPTWDDKYGVPQALQSYSYNTGLAAHAPQIDGAENRITYLIERMCNPNARPLSNTDGHAARDWCEMAEPKQAAGDTVNDLGTGLDYRQVYYRVTVRVDGKLGTNAVSFAQVMLR